MTWATGRSDPGVIPPKSSFSSRRVSCVLFTFDLHGGHCDREGGGHVLHGGLARRSGFTLLEIMIVLVIVALMAGLATPMISSMMQEAQMREPVEQLQAVAQEARMRAIKDGYPYEIIFSLNGFQARRYQLRSEAPGPPSSDETESLSAEEKQAREELKAEAAQIEADAMPTPNEETGKPVRVAFAPIERYHFAKEMTCRLLYWGRMQWIDPPAESEMERTPVQDRWIFQPSGLCNPLRVRFQKGEAWVEVTFSPLTGDIQDERSFFPE